MDVLIDTAAATAVAHAMFVPGAPVVIMVSGGADSVALLRAVAAGAFGPLPAEVLHVDHRLRGEASDGDASFVAQLCEALGVRCTVASLDVAGFAAEHGLNLEDAGRQVRYREADALLDAACARARVPAQEGRVVTAHTLDDRAETLLMRLAQGAGAGGLGSLGHRRGRIVRPLLDCTRADVVAYLSALGQEWREDASNADTTRLRARVRADLVPVLRDINPRFDEAVARTLRVLGDEDVLLDEYAGKVAVMLSTAATGQISIDRAAFAAVPRALQRRVLRSLLRDVFPEASRLEFDHIEAVCDGATDRSYARDLPEGLRAFAEYGRLIISRSAEHDGVPPSALTVPGMLQFEGVGRLTAEAGAAADPTSDPFTALVDADALTGPLTVSSVSAGDRIRPFGMRGTRKVSDVLIDAKVPVRRRSAVPVVRDGERIVWVAGVKSSEDYRVGPRTQRTVRLIWEPRSPEGDDT